MVTTVETRKISALGVYTKKSRRETIWGTDIMERKKARIEKVSAE